MDARGCPCATTIESRTHAVTKGECGIYKEKRDVLVEEIRKLDECGM